MSTVMQFLQTTFGPLVLVFTVSNLAAMGLQVMLPDGIPCQVKPQPAPPKLAGLPHPAMLESAVKRC